MKKKILKKLSLVLAMAMTVSAYAVPAKASESDTVTARYIGESKTSVTTVTSKTLWAGGRRVNFDYSIDGITSGLAGTWTSSDPTVVKVDKNTGVARAGKPGNAVITFVTDDGRMVSVNVKSRTRAKDLTVTNDSNLSGNGLPVYGSVDIEQGQTKTFYIQTNPGIKAMIAGSDYSTYFVHHSEDGLRVVNGSEDGSYSGDDYGKKVTITVPTETAIGIKTVKFTANPYTDDRTGSYDVSAELKVNVTAKTVKKATVYVEQVGTDKVKLTNVPSTAGITISNGVRFDVAKDSSDKEIVQKNADGTFNITVNTRTPLVQGTKYVFYDRDNKELGYFYALAARPDNIRFDKLTTDGTNGTGVVKVLDQWGDAYASSVNLTINGNSVSDVSEIDPKDNADGLYYFTVSDVKAGDTIRVNAKGTVTVNGTKTWEKEISEALTAVKATESTYKAKVVSDGIYINGIKAASLTTSNVSDASIKFHYVGTSGTKTVTGYFIVILDGSVTSVVTTPDSNLYYTVDLKNFAGYDTVGKHKITIMTETASTSVSYEIQ